MKIDKYILTIICSFLLPGIWGLSEAVADEDADAIAIEAEAIGGKTTLQLPEVGDAAGEKQRNLVKEATSALALTQDALQALENEQAEEAIEALEKVTGKLALIVARNPTLALAPVDVSVVTHDLYADADAVRAQVEAAEAFLDEGSVQAARAVLAVLASETRIRTSHIPLATYPDAILDIVPLIDSGNIEEAKAELQLALNTLVVTEEVIPLPVMRASALLRAAETLSENDERTAEQNDNLVNILDSARKQIELAEALGYGEKKQFKPILDEIKNIEKQTQGGKSKTGLFDSLKEKLSLF